MFSVVVEFVNGMREYFNNVNRAESENLYEKYMSLPEVSYVSIMDERF
jgi:hypothetical protein|nr:MAG TPA: hypothetical protein [Caudoviricetes sp.]